MKHMRKTMSLLLTLALVLTLLPTVAHATGTPAISLGAVGAGIISGTVDADGNIVLDPQGSATRAQVAAMFQRFCENVM